MSVLFDLNEDLSNLPDILARYESDLKDAESIIEIEGKLLGYANMENPKWAAYYDQRRIELHTMLKYLENNVQRIRGKQFRHYKEKYSRELGEREIQRYIDNEPAYLSAYELMLVVKEMHDKYQGIVEAFKIRGFALNNITKARVAEVQDYEIS